MSHIVYVDDFEIRSSTALGKACERLGYTLNGARIHVPGKPDLVLKNIGSQDQPVYRLGVDADTKDTASKLQQRYVVELAKEVARRQGGTVTETEMADGSIRVRVAM